MESSSEEELEENFPGHEWITPQSSVRAAYQSQTEKGIRKICSELLELKDAIENLCGNMQSKYHAFLRISEEVVEAEQELTELQKHVSAQGILVQDLISGVCRELEMWQKYSKDEHVEEKDFQTELNEILSDDTQDPKVIFLDKIDSLLPEHKIEEALLALEAEEKKYMATDDLGKESDAEISAYKTALFKRKSILENQLVRYSEQPSLSIAELRKSLSGLIKIGKGSLAHQLLLKAYGSRLQKNIETFLPTCSIYTETYSATLSPTCLLSYLKDIKRISCDENLMSSELKKIKMECFGFTSCQHRYTKAGISYPNLRSFSKRLSSVFHSELLPTRCNYNQCPPGYYGRLTMMKTIEPKQIRSASPISDSLLSMRHNQELSPAYILFYLL